MATFANLPMAAPTWPVSIAIVTIAYLIVSKILTYWRLAAFRGPFSTGVSELWIFRGTLAGDFHERSLDAIEQFGGEEAIARVGPNLLITSDTAFIKTLNDDRAWKKGSWYPAMALDPGHDSVFSTTDDALHDRLKSQLSRGVHTL